MTKRTEEYIERKKKERNELECKKVCRHVRRWAIRIMEKEGMSVQNKCLIHDGHYLASFVGRGPWERRSLIYTALYTIQSLKWNDIEYHF